MHLDQRERDEANELVRWTCPYHDPPVLLAMVDNAGHLQIKVRNRVWLVNEYSSVIATCPKCGARHTRKIADH